MFLYAICNLHFKWIAEVGLPVFRVNGASHKRKNREITYLSVFLCFFGDRRKCECFTALK